MQVCYTKCRSCGESIRVSAKFCFHCGRSARPIPVFWFSFLCVLYGAYVILHNMELV
ncbi:MAG: zinc-ribbon domain-containing protein [Candidatus Hydrogenedentes bacterium]|nr:zinc-ribbon domain-containing protein [Candidatus Hydrogenedentota bacterium]